MLSSKNKEFEDWKRRNPGAPFSEFYAENANRMIAQHKPHRTLGSNLVGQPYGKAGERFFNRLVEYGLTPNATCVDFGCGTLRIGIHVIRFLEPRHYWGMDISEPLLNEGRRLVGEKLCSQKLPNLRLISPQAIEEVVRARPDFLFSSKVLQHVHPLELCEYLSNIMTIIGSSGRAIIHGQWNKGDTIQLEGAWAHDLAFLEAATTATDCRMIMLMEHKIVRDGAVTSRRHGDFLLIRHCHNFGGLAAKHDSITPAG